MVAPFYLFLLSYCLWYLVMMVIVRFFGTGINYFWEL